MTMKKLITVFAAAALTLGLAGALAACAPQSADSFSDSDSAATKTTEYSSDSLMAYHAGIGQDLAAFTEVSKENCSQCHGDWIKIQEETADVLQKEGYTANPHANHMTKELDCDSCHKLTEASTLSCDESCHTWELPDVPKGVWEQ